MPRYVILRHDVPEGYERPSHWDLMLEDDGVLRTWALPLVPDSGAPIDAERLADHRLAYLEYEGPISGARGCVTRWDEGHFAPVEQGETQWIVELAGRRLRGRVSLTQITEASASEVQRWRFSFSPAEAGAEATGLNSGSQRGEPSELPNVVRPAT